MASLVAYASSEEEDEEGEEHVELSSHQVDTAVRHDDVDRPGPASGNSPDSKHFGDSAPEPAQGPQLDPSAPDNQSTADTPPTASFRAQVQALTMPRYPNFNIPRSTSPPAANSEEAAELVRKTRKFERFLELKKQGVHFNDRLAASSATRNPQLFQKLADFAGITPIEQYETSLGNAYGVPTDWPAGFLEDLIASNKSKLKKERAQRTTMGFVPAKLGNRQP